MTSPLINRLESDWAKHKYAVLEKDPAVYQTIRTLLKNKQAPDSALFYTLIDQALSQPDLIGRQENALQHVWGYFKNDASPEEKAVFEDKHSRWMNRELSLNEVKRELYVLSVKYQRTYLLNSTYFDVVR